RAGSALISSVQETGARVAVLAEHIPVSLSYGIATFVSLRQSEVRILAITAILAPEGGWSISASGISDTRDALAAFERTLKGDRRFADVDLPLASFAKDKTLPFTVTVAYRDTQP
ncbi:MAG: hypothetical protein Q8R17_00345, partial [bacterium]|nr:hypothetical protein [bacterium]